MLEEIIDKNIRKIKREIKKRNTDKWQNSWRDTGGCRDTNSYFWFHCGEKENFDGKLDALLNLKNDINFAKKEKNKK